MIVYANIDLKKALLDGASMSGIVAYELDASRLTPVQRKTLWALHEATDAKRKFPKQYVHSGGTALFLGSYDKSFLNLDSLRLYLNENWAVDRP